MKEWTELGLKMKSDQGWKGTVAMIGWLVVLGLTAL